MGKAVKVNFEKARKRRQFLYSARRVILLGLVMLAVILVVFINNLLVEKGLTTRISDMMESFGGPGFPIELPGGVIKDVKAMGKNLVVLNDTNLYIYSAKARQMSNLQQMTENTLMLTNGSEVLAYDTGGKNYRISSPSKLLTQKETEDSILAADLSESHVYAIATSPKRYVAMVTVYDARAEPIFYSYSADNHLTGVSLSPKGDMMATSGVNTSGGMLQSFLTLYRFSSEEEIAQLVFDDALILHIDFLEDNRIGVLTDNEYTVTDSSGIILFSYPLAGVPITMFRTWGRETLFLAEYKELRQSELILLGSELKETWKLTLGSGVRGISIGAKKIYVLDETGISTYNRAGELTDRLDMRGISRIYLAGDSLYYFTQDEICVLNSISGNRAGV